MAVEFPRFLIISPPKTGSTWLADNLRCHPELFVPDIKEVKYFSMLFRAVSRAWYADQFAGAEGRIAGEASPSYAALPLERIRTIGRLLPDVKLIYLMREPVSRTWSHVKHTHQYREAAFAECTESFERVSEPEWRDACSNPWIAASGDYLGHLQRWTSVFPAGQFFIGFFDSIESRPADLLRDVLRFLGVDAGIGLSAFPVAERILPGPSGDIPTGVRSDLEARLEPGTARLRTFLRERFAIEVPSQWGPFSQSGSHATFPDEQLERIRAEESGFRTAFRQLHLNYRGYDLLFYRGRLLAVPTGFKASTAADLESLPTQSLLAERAILSAPNLDELRDVVSNRAIEQLAARYRDLEQKHVRAREEISHLSARIDAIEKEMLRPSRSRALAQRLRASLGFGFRRRIGM